MYNAQKESESYMFTNKDHTFVICAHGNSEFLEVCIESLLRQTVKSRIIVSSSTTTPFLLSTCEKFQLELISSEDNNSGIAADWNRAYGLATTNLVTLAHQDDIYHPRFTEQVISYANQAKQPLIIFTDYDEVHSNKRVRTNRLLKTKRLMMTPLKCSYLWRSIFVRRRMLSFGSPISCPTVTYVKDNLPNKLFLEGFKSDLDWQAWESLSKLRGDFVYIPSILMSHRIHEGSATTAVIRGNGGRAKEDYQMFCKFWPKPIAWAICKMYSAGEKQNIKSL